MRQECLVFAKKLAGTESGHLLWTAEEHEAWRTVAQVQATRAMFTTDSAGGYLSPLIINPAIRISSNGSVNPLRQIAKVVQTTSESWNGVTSAGVTAEWSSESSEAADASPTLAQPSIPVYKASAFVPFSVEIQGDAINFMQELGTLLMDGHDQLTATAYAIGSGSNQPTGIITDLTGGSSVVNAAVSETFTAADVFAVQNALGPRFQPWAQWCANLAIINAARQFETTNGALKFPELAGNPPMLLNRAMNELSGMDGAINVAATESNLVLAYGDWSNFVIVARIGAQVEIVTSWVPAAGRLVSAAHGCGREPEATRSSTALSEC